MNCDNISASIITELNGRDVGAGCFEVSLSF